METEDQGVIHLWLSNPVARLYPKMRSVWRKKTVPRIESMSHRAYWSEHDVVSHLVNDLEVASGKQNKRYLQVDWHLDFSLKPSLFDSPLSQSIETFNATGNYRRARPDLIANLHDNVSDPFLIHGEAKVWFGGDWQPTVQDLRDDLVRLDTSQSSGVCKAAVMIVVFDPQGQAVPKGVNTSSICAELVKHPAVKVLEYPVAMCERDILTK